MAIEVDITGPFRILTHGNSWLSQHRKKIVPHDGHWLEAGDEYIGFADSHFFPRAVSEFNELISEESSHIQWYKIVDQDFDCRCHTNEYRDLCGGAPKNESCAGAATVMLSQYSRELGDRIMAPTPEDDVEVCEVSNLNADLDPYGDLALQPITLPNCVPAAPPHVIADAELNVPADGLCGYHCLIALQNLKQWIETHDQASGRANSDEIAEADKVAALKLRKEIVALATHQHRPAQAARLSKDGVERYISLDDMDLLASYLKGKIVVSMPCVCLWVRDRARLVSGRICNLRHKFKTEA